MLQRLAQAIQQRLAAQNQTADGSSDTEIERTHSSKVPWLVVGPDGIELAIAHKERLPRATTADNDQIKTAQVRTAVCLLCMARKTASVLLTRHAYLPLCHHQCMCRSQAYIQCPCCSGLQFSNGPASLLSMTTSTAGLLSDMHHHLTSQPSNAESTSDSIQAIHWPNFGHPVAHTLPGPTSSSANGTPAAMNFAEGHRPNASGRNSPRPLFSAVVET